MGSTSVLVVEDNPIFRAAAMDVLENLGLRVFGAYSGEVCPSLHEGTSRDAANWHRYPYAGDERYRSRGSGAQAISTRDTRPWLSGSCASI
jgi:CheY-like chemotaxis protein